MGQTIHAKLIIKLEQSKSLITVIIPYFVEKCQDKPWPRLVSIKKKSDTTQTQLNTVT